MAYNRYNLGTAVLLECTFQVSSTDTDPTTVSLSVSDPNGNTDIYTYSGGTVIKTATGKYNKEITPDERGYWKYTWTGTGTCTVVNSHKFIVE